MRIRTLSGEQIEIRYNCPEGKCFCDVTVRTPDGKRHTITVQSESVYDAAIQFFSRASTAFPGDGQLPKTEAGTVFEVRPISHAKLMEWANKKAEIYARSWKFRKWR